MKISTSNPEVSIETTSAHCEDGEGNAHETWIAHCEGQTIDEAALSLTEDVMQAYAALPHKDATEFTFGVIRDLLSNSRKPVGTLANAQGGAQ